MVLITAVKVTYELVGQEISDIGIQGVVSELQRYPPLAVEEALSRCRKELRKLTLADILDRLPGGHPKVEEAWAMVSRALNSEDVTLVWTEEMWTAFGVASQLSDDPVAARMAFKETYTEAVNKARATNQPPAWRVSLGWDKAGRELALQEAVEKGRISIEHAHKLIPDYTIPEHISEWLPSIRSVT